ncbi:MAG: Na/Pi cotransporter family protein [Gammaproteobacteria bacterium]|nr:MAG: Na/Pi cotransporter family protein [Gammaproteobacteria bacterium]
MKRNALLTLVFVLLGYAFWASPDFKTIAAGVAIFLLGMLSLEQGFKAFSGGVLEGFLQKTTDRTWESLSFGIVSTTLMQSSSLVSVLTISFLSAGLIPLAQGIGIIFGSNLGTTTGAWLVAGLGLKVDIAAYAMPMLVFGVIMIFQKNNKRLEGAGWVLVGLGFLFLGIAYMKGGFETVGAQVDLSQFAIPGFRGLLIYLAIGIAATVVMQSSHATLILTITALAAGQVTYENALALAIGSNIGTTITAIIGAISASVSGRQLALAHLIFNLVTGLIAVVFIGQFATGVDWVSGLVGIAADNYTLKFAVFHTLFNLVGVVLMLPLINRLVVFLQKVLREKVEPVDMARVLFLNKSALEFPDTALEVIAREIMHLAFNAFEILAHGLNLNRRDITSSVDINELLARCDVVMDIDVEDLYKRKAKPLYSAIIEYSTRAETDMEPEQVDRLQHLRQASRQIVNAIKAMKELQDNIDRYMCHENEFARREYNEIRLNLAILLRILFRSEDVAGTLQKLKLLEEFKLTLEEKDIIANGKLDKLIREQRITSDMATSLMNDSAYAYDIQRNLIEAAEVIFGNLFSLDKDLSLSDEEIDRLMRERRAEIYAKLREEEAQIDAITGYERHQ